MKIIFDNIIFYLQKSGGGTIYWLELIKRASSDDSFKAIFSEPKAKLTNKFRLGLPISIGFYERLPLSLLRITNFKSHLKEKAIFHSSYYRVSNSKKAINVVTIHDFTPEYYFQGLRKFIHQKRKRNAIFHSHGIICISNNTKQDLLTLYPDVNEDKIRVIYNGVSDDYYPISKISTFNHPLYAKEFNSKYILYVGHRTSYKNFYVAAEALSLLDDSFNFFIVGEGLSKKEIVELNKLLPNRFFCFSGIDNETLNLFYNFANCLIYPSSYEGFGIPILEAMKAGCPVVTTNKSSIPEVAGYASEIVSEIDPEVFKNSILRLNNKSYRNSLIQKGFEQASKFSWDKCYNEVKIFYNELYFSNDKVF